MALIDKDKLAELIWGDAQFRDDIEPMEAAERIMAHLLEGAEVQVGMGIFTDVNKPPARVAVMSNVEDAETFCRMDPKHRDVVVRRRATVETAWEVAGDEV